LGIVFNGNYAIGLSKEWAIKNGLNSVLYIENNSNIAKDISRKWGLPL